MTKGLRMIGMGAATAVTVAAGPQGLTTAMDSLVNAERAFARMSVETTQREAFLANFADDGVWFTPGPANTRRALTAQPAPAQPPPTTLDWRPVTGDVSSSGDLGYTTGPWTSTEKATGRPVSNGWYFTVWGRHGDRPWKVRADFGVQRTGATPDARLEFRRAEVRPVVPTSRPDLATCAAELRAADAAFAAAATARGMAAALEAHATEDVCLFRQGLAPIEGRAAALSSAAGTLLRLVWQPSEAAASVAGDLGFTYGSYTQSAAGGAEQRGFYLHVWKRRPGGWRLAVEVTN